MCRTRIATRASLGRDLAKAAILALQMGHEVDVRRVYGALKEIELTVTTFTIIGSEGRFVVCLRKLGFHIDGLFLGHEFRSSCPTGQFQNEYG